MDIFGVGSVVTLSSTGGMTDQSVNGAEIVVHVGNIKSHYNCVWTKINSGWITEQNFGNFRKFLN